MKCLTDNGVAGSSNPQTEVSTISSLHFADCGFVRRLFEPFAIHFYPKRFANAKTTKLHSTVFAFRSGFLHFVI